MVASKDIIYEEIDRALDQLIENEEALNLIQDDPKFDHEKEALEKLQESLLAHLTHVNYFVENHKIGFFTKSKKEKRKELYSKCRQVKQIQSSYEIPLEKTLAKEPCPVRKSRKMQKIRL